MWLSAGMWQMLLDGWTCMFSCIAGEQCPSPEQCPRARMPDPGLGTALVVSRDFTRTTTHRTHITMRFSYAFWLTGCSASSLQRPSTTTAMR